jgi:hypothetical protein
LGGIGRNEVRPQGGGTKRRRFHDSAWKSAPFLCKGKSVSNRCFLRGKKRLHTPRFCDSIAGMDSMEDTKDICGRKIFFLYPQTIIQNEVATDLIMQEYEVYTVNDHTALRRSLKRFPNSIVFVNIDERLTEKEWEAWIHGVMTEPETAGTGIGVLTSGHNVEVKEKFLSQLKITCGFINVSTDVKKLLLQLLTVLRKQDALGRRKYIRVSTENEKAVAVNIPLDGHFLNGVIKDISSAGFSCTFPQSPVFLKGTHISNVQLKLQSSLIRVEGIVFGFRMEGYERVYVVLFTPNTESDVKLRIRKYIQTVLWSKMEQELKS